MEDTLFWRILIPLALTCARVSGQTTWVWNNNRSPQSGNTANNALNNPNFGQVDFGRDKNSQGGRVSIFPDSPSRPSTTSIKDNNALPEDSIRLVNNGNSEARLIPGAANFVSNALQSIGGNGGGGSGNGGTGGGLFSIGGNLIGSIFQSVPQLAGSAIEILLGRPSKGNGASSSSSSPKPSSSSGSGGATTLPGSAPSFPILTPGGSGSSLGRPAGNSGSGNSNSGGNCQCLPLNSCFLPRRPGASCAGGNIMCCQTSTRTRSIDDLKQNTQSTRETKNGDEGSTPSRAEVRIGLLENIVKGSGNVVDDALDLLLHRYYTEEDQQRIATRVLKSG